MTDLSNLNTSRPVSGYVSPYEANNAHLSHFLNSSGSSFVYKPSLSSSPRPPAYKSSNSTNGFYYKSEEPSPTPAISITIPTMRNRTVSSTSTNLNSNNSNKTLGPDSGRSNYLNQNNLNRFNANNERVASRPLRPVDGRLLMPVISTNTITTTTTTTLTNIASSNLTINESSSARSRMASPASTVTVPTGAPSIVDESRLLLREYEQLRSDSVSEIQRAHDSLNAR